MADTEQPPIDPFADDIVEDPRHVDYSVPGLNEKVTDTVVAKVDALREPDPPRSTVRSRKATLILSPRAGFGKSHLVGTLFKRLSGRATLVNVRPFQDPETCWKSILMRMVQELDFPDRYTGNGDATATQLELFAHGALSQVVVEHLRAVNGKPQTIEALSKPAEELTWLKTNSKWRDAVTQHIGNSKWVGRVRQQLARQGMSPRVNLESWLRVLDGYAYREDWSIRQACIEWIQGDPIDDEVARQIGIRPADLVQFDQTAAAINELAKLRVMDLCMLAGLFRPFLICFDQTETYGQHAELARALGLVTTDLTDEARNQLTLITANVDPWEKRLRGHWEQASLDRLDKPLILEGVNPDQGRELAEHRMAALDVPSEQENRFWGKGQWLNDLFRDKAEMSVRMFLHACSQRWTEVFEHAPAEGADDRRTPLPTLFQKYIDDISAKPRRLVYDRDTFYWLVSELADGIDGVAVDKVASNSTEHLPRWRYGDKQFIFGFESGTHWKRWHNIARSVLDGGKRRDSILVYPRTPDLPKIPKNTWKVAKPEIEQAKRARLLILTLDKHQLLRVYAAHELHTDALQGDIDWQTEEVSEYLRGELSELWRSILEWPDKSESAQTDETEQQEEPEHPSGPSGSQELQHSVVEIVRRRKFLSLEDLMEKLPGEPERETVLEMCGNVERIKVHTHPNKTLVQWRSTG